MSIALDQMRNVYRFTYIGQLYLGTATGLLISGAILHDPIGCEPPEKSTSPLGAHSELNKSVTSFSSVDEAASTAIYSDKWLHIVW